MRCVSVFISALALLFVLTMGNVSASLSELESDVTNLSFLVNQPMLYGDVDVFLGQNKRRHGGGGRVWTNVYYGDSRLKPKGIEEVERLNPRFYGLQVGFDLGKPRGVHTTHFFNVNRSTIRLSEGKSTVDNYHLGFGKFRYFEMAQFAFVGSIGYDRYEISSEETNRGDGLQTSLFGEFGLNFPLGQQWAFKPFYALQYCFLYQGRIGERRGRNDHGLNQMLGWRLDWQPLHQWQFQSRAVWVRELLRNPPPFYQARFSPIHGINTPAIMFYDGNTGRDYAWLGLGARLECALNVYLFLDYDVLLNLRHITHLGSVGFLLGW